jgi:acyl-ACP thioesterase
VWQESIRIHSYDADFRLRASPEALCRAFLEAAWNHAEVLGVGHGALGRQQKLWVLGRLLLRIESYPAWGQTVHLRTWPRGISGAFALRDFEIVASDEKLLAAGASSWLILEASTHRPQRVDKVLQSLPTPVPRRALEREPDKLRPVREHSQAGTREVRYSDVDVNRHVNSARYLGWLLDSYPAQFHQTHVLRSLEVNYLAETLWPDSLSIKTQQHAAEHFAHSIVKSNQEEACRAELIWKPESAIGHY